MMVSPQPAARISSEDLAEVVAHMRKALLARGESLAPEWFDQAVADLRAGTLRGYFLPAEADDGAGISFSSERPPRAFGHVHVESGRTAANRALQLTEALLSGTAGSVDRLDFGVTGLARHDSAVFDSGIRKMVQIEMLHRLRVRMRIDSGSVPGTVRWPSKWTLESAEKVPVDELQTTDWNSFRGSADEQLIASTPEGNRRVLEGILHGSLGRFLPEASPAIRDPSGQLAGFLLTAEENARAAQFVDLVVVPGLRRRGLGARLMAQGLRALLALGYSSVTLWVTESNLPARALYARLGFEPISDSAIYRWKRTAGSTSAGAPQPQVAR